MFTSWLSRSLHIVAGLLLLAINLSLLQQAKGALSLTAIAFSADFKGTFFCLALNRLKEL
jgi:hypothetical protein